MSLIRVILQAIRERRLPMFGWSNGDTIRANCPRCHTSILLAKIKEGEHAFTCPSCGESAIWKADE